MDKVNFWLISVARESLETVFCFSRVSSLFENKIDTNNKDDKKTLI